MRVMREVDELKDAIHARKRESGHVAEHIVPDVRLGHEGAMDRVMHGSEAEEDTDRTDERRQPRWHPTSVPSPRTAQPCAYANKG